MLPLVSTLSTSPSLGIRRGFFLAVSSDTIVTNRPAAWDELADAPSRRNSCGTLSIVVGLGYGRTAELRMQKSPGCHRRCHLGCLVQLLALVRFL